jgi:hypothetical protein
LLRVPAAERRFPLVGDIVCHNMPLYKARAGGPFLPPDWRRRFEFPAVFPRVRVGTSERTPALET